MIAYLQGKDTTVEVPDNISESDLSELATNFSPQPTSQDAAPSQPASPPVNGTKNPANLNTEPNVPRGTSFKRDFFESYVKPNMDRLKALEPLATTVAESAGKAITTNPAEIAQSPEMQAFAGKAAEELSFGIAKPLIEPLIEKQAKDHPVYANVGSVAGGLGSLLATGGLLKIAGLGVAAGAAGEVGAKAGFEAAQRFIPRAIMSGATFGTKRFIDETVRHFQGNGLDLADFGLAVVKDTALGGVLGAVGGLANAPVAIGSASGLGYLSAKAEGADNKEAVLTATIWGLFEAVGSFGRTENLRREAVDNLGKTIGEYVEIKNPEADFGREGARVVGRNIVENEIKKQGFSSVDDLIKDGPENTLQLIENINQKIIQASVPNEPPLSPTGKNVPLQIDWADAKGGEAPPEPTQPSAPPAEPTAKPRTLEIPGTENLPPLSEVQTEPQLIQPTPAKPVRVDETGLPIRKPEEVVSKIQAPDGTEVAITHKSVLAEAEGLRDQELTQWTDKKESELVDQIGKIRITDDLENIGDLENIPWWLRKKIFSPDPIYQTLDEKAQELGISERDLLDEIVNYTKRQTSAPSKNVADYYDRALHDLEGMAQGEGGSFAAEPIGQYQAGISQPQQAPSPTGPSLPGQQGSDFSNEESQRIFPLTDVTSDPSISGHPDFARLSSDVLKIVNHYAKSRGIEPTADFAQELMSEFHGILGKIITAADDQKLAIATQIKAQYPDIENEFTTLRDKLWSDKTTGFFKRNVAGKYGSMRPTISKAAEPSAKYAGVEPQPIFYSAVEKAVTDKMPAKASPDQVMGLLKNTPGIKQEELDWLGLDEFLKDKKSVTKQELQDFVRANNVQIKEVMKGGQLSDIARTAVQRIEAKGYQVKMDPEGDGGFEIYQGDQVLQDDDLPKDVRALSESLQTAMAKTGTSDTKFAKYTLPGGKNYRELLLTLPEKPESEPILTEGLTIKKMPDGTWNVWDSHEKPGWVHDKGSPTKMDLFDRIRGNSLLVKPSRQEANFKSSHFSEPNVLAHIRFNDRVDADGNKVLFIEEVQSDWHQRGRNRGYIHDLSAAEKSELKSLQEKIDIGKPQPFGLSQEEFLRWKELDGATGGTGGGVPDAPFKKTWSELAMKRMLRYAAENGYDKIAWTTGEQQSERYDLSKQIDSVEAFKNSRGNYNVKAFKGENGLIDKTNIPESELAAIIGKDLAEKIIKDSADGKNHEYSGLDLKVGGEGMKGFYDQIIPSFLNKYTKKWGGRVGETNIESGASNPDESKFRIDRSEDSGIYYILDENDDIVDEAETRRGAERKLSRLMGTEPGNIKVHSLDITPSMKESVQQGQALFENAGNPYQQELSFEGEKTNVPQAEGKTAAPQPTVRGGFKALQNPHLEVEFKEVGAVIIPNRKIQEPADLAYAFKELKNEAQENFFFTAVKNGRIVAVEHLGFGTIDQVAVYPFETISLIDKTKADSFYLVHNHPSGEIQPSEADKHLTGVIKRALERQGANFLGHVIIDDGKFGFIAPDMGVSEGVQKEYLKTKKISVLKKYFEWSKSKSETAGPMMNSPHRVFEVMKGVQTGTDEGVLHLLDTQNRILNSVIIPHGQFTARNVQQLSAAYRASGIVGVNSGLSNAELQNLQSDLKDVNIRYLDDVKTKENGAYQSALEHGVFEKPAQFKAAEEGALFNNQKENVVQRYERLKQQAIDQGMTPGQAIRLAREQLKSNTEPVQPQAAGNLQGGEMFSSAGAAATNRIPVTPIAGGKIRKLDEIIFNVAKALGTKIRYGKVPRKAGGYYAPASGSAIIRFAGDLDATAHELAHALDDRFGILSEWGDNPESGFDKELAKFWVFGSVTKSGPHSTLPYRRAEGVAEWVRAWLVNPAEAVGKAPGFAKFFMSKITGKTRNALMQFSDDIRSFAGATAHDQIMANVDWEPKNSGILDFMSGGRSDPKNFQVTVFDKMVASWVDSLQAYKKAVNFARGEAGIEKLLPANDPFVLARLYNGIHGKVGAILKYGMIDALGKQITPGGMNWLFQSLDSSSVEALNREVQETATFMLAQRTIEKAAQLGRENVSGIGGGIMSDVSVAEKRLADLKKDPAKFARIQEAASRYRQWSNSLLDYMQESGRLSAETVDTIKKNNEQYVAMKRLMEMGPDEDLEIRSHRGLGGKGIGVVAQPIQKFKGSTRQILNPYTSLMESTYRVIREADRNRILLTFRNLLASEAGRKIGQGEVPKFGQIGRIAKSGDPNTIPIYVNGQKEIWQFEPDVFKSMKGITGEHYRLPWAATILPQIFRAGIVNFPPFMVRNVLRDIQTRLIISETNSGLLDQWRKRGDMDVRNLQIYGGDQFGHYMRDRVDYARAMKVAMARVAHDGKSILLNPAAVGDLWENVSAWSEKTGRLAEFHSAIRYAKEKLGYDDFNAMLYAAFKARDLMDFAVAGDATRLINQVIPFTSAQVGGMRVSAEAAKRNPTSFLAKWALVALVPALAEYFWNSRDPKNLTEYRQQPAWLRDLFYNFKVGPDLWLRLPKAFDFGVLSSGVTRLIDKMNGNEHAFEGYAGSALRALLPIDESALAGPFRGAIQTMTNWDFFRNRSIIPPDESKLDLSLRDTSKASRLSKVLQKVIGADARNIDFMLTQMLGFTGSFAAKLSDIGREDRRGIGLPETGLFVGAPAYSSRDVQWVMNYAGQFDQTRSREYEVLKLYLNQYLDAKEGSEKDKAASELRDFASEVRAEWEKDPPEPKTPRIRQRLADLLSDK